MKKYTILISFIAVIFFAQAVSAQCPADDIVLNTQYEVDSFAIQYPGCTDLTGGLKIIVYENQPPIVNLNGLTPIHSIAGDLEIRSRSLQSFSGLENLTSVGGNLVIDDCDSILNMEGLNHLDVVGGDFEIFGCDTLFDLQGLDSMSYVGGALNIGTRKNYTPDHSFVNPNPRLRHLTGLESLDSIGGGLLVAAPVLESFAGLNNLQKIGGVLHVEGCDSLVNFQGLGNLKEVDSIALSPWVMMQYNLYWEPTPNAQFQDFTGLESLIHVNSINIGNTPLQSFNGLQNITSLKTLIVTSNWGLSNFEGLNNLTEITENFFLGGHVTMIRPNGDFFIYIESSITSFGGLEKVTDVGNFRVANCNQLLNYSGLENLRRIHGFFHIGGMSGQCAAGYSVFLESNDTLSLEGLSLLQSIGGDFHIIGNNKIKDFTHLSALDSIGGDLVINSSSMESLNGLSSSAFIGGDIRFGNYFLSLMKNFHDLSQLTFVDTVFGSLSIIDLDSLEYLTGLDNLKYVEQDLIIAGNDRLKNLDVLSGLEAVGEDFSLGSYPRLNTSCSIHAQAYKGFPHPNPDLESIGGLANLKTIGGTFTFAGCYQIENLDDLSSLEHIGGDVNIGFLAHLGLNGWIPGFLENKSLLDISALENVAFNGSVFVNGNPKLVDLTGIGGRDSLETLEITFCDSLHDLEGLGGIQYVKEFRLAGYPERWYSPFIPGSKNIQTLSGFDSDVYVDKVEIQYNPHLEVCGYPWVCDAVSRGMAWIQYNGVNCSSVSGLFCDGQTIYGEVFFDENQNKNKDVNEVNIPYQKIQFEPSGHIVVTSETGNYFRHCDEAVPNTIKWVPDSLWQLSTDSAEYTLTCPAGSPPDNYREFGLTPVAPFHKEKISLYSDIIFCNDLIQLKVLCENLGTFPESGKIELSYDSLTAFVSSLDSNAVVDTVNRLITWQYDSLGLFEKLQRDAVFALPAQSVVDSQLYYQVRIYRDSSGNDILMDQYTYTPTVECSTSQNNVKQVIPAGLTDEHYTLHGQKLTYTIHFKNMTDDNIENLTIIDTIDTNLDINTLHIVNSSFPVQMTIQGQVAEFFFKGIKLLGSSHTSGFITYDILPKEGLADYTKIKNTAYMFFDSIGPVVTNTTANTMVSVISSVSEQADDAVVYILPNPAHDIIHISARGYRAVDKVLIYNGLGQLVLSQKGATVDVSHLPKGIYHLKIEVGDRTAFAKLVIQ